MRLILAILLAGTLAACSQSRVAGDRAAVMAVAANNTVDLRSADGVMFLQSSQTGFLEAPPMPVRPARGVSAPSPDRRIVRASARGDTLPGARPARLGGPEVGDRQPVSPVVATPRPPAPPGTPEITVRPLPDALSAPPEARSLREALASAYDTNPAVNQARAELRAADEGVAIARSGNRPVVTAGVSSGIIRERDVNTPFGSQSTGNATETTTPTSVQLQVTQPLFRGFQTRNETRAAEANVRAERARLETVVQDVLFETALAVLDVRRFRAAVALRQRELTFLLEQVAAARSRLEFGEATSTDVAQAEARTEDTRAALLDARAALAAAEARFRELTGLSADQLDVDIDVVRLLPDAAGEALRVALEGAPDIERAIHEADEAMFDVKALQGQALPSVSVTGRVRADIDAGAADRTESAEVRLNVDIPIYQAGRVSAEVRQAKEQLGSARIAVDLARDTIRSQVTTAWATLDSATAAISAADRSITAAERALAGVLEELRVGQRTTIDVLNAQQDLIRAQVTRLNAIRERDAAAFRILRSMGALEPGLLALPVNVYDVSEHYRAVRDQWAGMRTPDGR